MHCEPKFKKKNYKKKKAYPQSTIFFSSMFAPHHSHKKGLPSAKQFYLDNRSTAPITKRGACLINHRPLSQPQKFNKLLCTPARRKKQVIPYKNSGGTWLVPGRVIKISDQNRIFLGVQIVLCILSHRRYQPGSRSLS